MAGTKSPAEALAATIADFKANPKLRIRAELARNADGFVVHPLDPKATCFCAIGRYAFHRGVDTPGDPRVGLGVHYRRIMAELPITSDRDVWGENDKDLTPTGDYVIPALEAILAKMTPELAPA